MSVNEEGIAPTKSYQNISNELKNIWAQVFCLNKNVIDVNHNFFELGGNSLLAMSILSRIHRVFSVQIDIKTFYHYSSIYELAKHIEAIKLANCKNNKIAGDEAPIIKNEERNSCIPLSHEQHGIWIAEIIHPDNAAYNISSVFHITGEINIRLLNLAIKSIVNRHNILKKIFKENKGEPQQISIEPDFSKIDIKPKVIPGYSLSNFKEWLYKEACRPFSIDIWPLFNIQLYKLDGLDRKEYLLFICFHHIIVDVMSMTLFAKELSFFYQAYSLSKEPCLPHLKHQNDDYVFWQKKHMETSAVSQQLCFWKEKLSTMIPLDFPADHARLPIHTFNSHCIELILPRRLSQSLKQFAYQSTSSLYVVMLSIFQVLLSRYCAQDDISIGCPKAGHTLPHTENLLGAFGNLLVLRMQLGDNPSFFELIKCNQDLLNDALSHPDISIEQLLKVLAVTPDHSRHPIVQILLVALPSGLDELVLGNVVAKNYPISYGSSAFDMALFYQELPSEIHLRLEYNRDLYSLDTMQTLLSNFTILASNAINHCHSALTELSLFSCDHIDDDDDDGENIHENNNLPKKRGYSLAQLFIQQVHQSHQAIALVHGEQKLSYAELDIKSNQLAHYLIKKGAQTEDFVILYLERGIDAIIAILAILKADCAYVAIETTYPMMRVEHILINSQARFIITHVHLNDCLSNVLQNSSRPIQRILMDAETDSIHQSPQHYPDVNYKDDRLAYVIYTSGTQGRPKGIALEHHVVTHLIEWQTQLFSHKNISRTTQFAPLGFDVSVQEIFYALLNGYELHIIPTDLKYSLFQFVEYLQVNDIDQIFLPTALLHYFSEEVNYSQSSLEHLKDIIVAGQALIISSEIKKLFTDKSHLRLTNQYGPSETHVATSYTLPKDVVTWESAPSIGRAIGQMKVYVLSKNMQHQPKGVIGELYIGSQHIAREYIFQEALTKEKFIKNSFTTELDGRIYKTGDFVKLLDDGNIAFIGRMDDQVKIRGFRIELGEIEAVLLQHEYVKDCVVLVEQKPNLNIIAYVVLNNKKNINEIDSIRVYLRELLPDYMLPQAVLGIDRIPFTAHGKADKQALLNMKPATLSSLTEYAPAENDCERQLLLILSEVLNITQDIKKIGVQQNLFEIGLTSISLIKFISEVKERMSSKLTPDCVFKLASIRKLAGLIQSRQKSSAVSIE